MRRRGRDILKRKAQISLLLAKPDRLTGAGRLWGRLRDSETNWSRFGGESLESIALSRGIVGDNSSSSEIREKAQTGWRRRRDSNPRNARTLNGFQDRRIQPLCHSSAAGRFLLYSPRQNASPVMKLPALRRDMVNQAFRGEGASFLFHSPYVQLAMVNSTHWIKS